MKILFLGPNNEKQVELKEYLDSKGNEVFLTEDRLISDNYLKFDFLISFGYRYILSKKVLKAFNMKAINLHISYLPWNRGADPNFWSFVDNTPKGVTIHLLDEGIDTGDIIFQEELFFDKNETLSSSYNKLQSHIVKLFKHYWVDIKQGNFILKKQKDIGTFHYKKDKSILFKNLKDGWKTSIWELESLGKKNEDKKT